MWSLTNSSSAKTRSALEAPPGANIGWPGGGESWLLRGTPPAG